MIGSVDKLAAVSAAAYQYLAGGDVAQTGDCLGQLALAVAGHARDAQDFPGVDIQRDAVQRW